jgi:CTP:molybdopterin cytidylyltransferase MocA
MIRYVIEALRGASLVNRTVLVAPRSVLSSLPAEVFGEERVEGEGDLSAAIAAGLSRCPGAEEVLLVTADIPFVRSVEVDAYVRAAQALGLDCAYCAVPLEACLREFPGMKRTTLRTPVGRFTGGNVVLLRTEAFPRMVEFVRQAYARRKNPVFLASLIGLPNVVRLLTGRLTLERVGAAASRAIGVRAGLVVSSHAALGTDIDRPEDLHLARGQLRPPDVSALPPAAAGEAGG